MILVKINCSKIEKARLFKGEKGQYLDLVLMENRDGKDQYGNDGFVAHSVTKSEKDAGVKGTIIGNFKILGGSKPAEKKPANKQTESPAPPESDDVPF